MMLVTLRMPREEPRALLFEEMSDVYGSATSPIPTDEHLYHGGVARWVGLRYGKYKYIRTLVAGGTISQLTVGAVMARAFLRQAGVSLRQPTRLAVRARHTKTVRSWFSLWQTLRQRVFQSQVDANVNAAGRITNPLPCKLVLSPSRAQRLLTTPVSQT